MIEKEFGKRLLFAGFASLGLYACFGGADDAAGEVAAFDGIADAEVISALGNEPCWSVRVDGDTLTYATPENMDGDQIAITRFAGNGGLSVSSEFEGALFTMAVTPGECSDTMSDRSYPFIVTLAIGDAQLNGCAYTDRQPYVAGGE